MALLRLPTVLGFLLCGSASSLAQAQGFGDVLLETLHNDNVSRSEQPAEKREDSVVAAALRTGLHLQPGIFTGVDLRAGLSKTLHRRYQGLDGLELTVGLSLTRKFGVGGNMPTLSVEAGFGRQLFDMDLRDAWFHRLGLRGSKRFSDRLNLTLQFGYEQQDGDHDAPRIPVAPPGGGPAPRPKPGNPWSLDLAFLALQGEYDLNELSWLGANWRYQHGDIVSSSRTYPRIVAAATAITDDPAFGPGVIAYRLPADTHTLSLDYNRAVLDAGTAYVGIEYQDTRAASAIEYRVHVIRAGFVYSF